MYRRSRIGRLICVEEEPKKMAKSVLDMLIMCMGCALVEGPFMGGQEATTVKVHIQGSAFSSWNL